MQSETSECGLASLAMVLCYHGQDMNLAELRRRASMSLRGSTLADLTVIASRFGLESRALRCEPEDFRQLRHPAILHWEFNHFVVLVKLKRNRVLIHDPALGTRQVSIDEVFPQVYRRRARTLARSGLSTHGQVAAHEDQGFPRAHTQPETESSRPSVRVSAASDLRTRHALLYATDGR